MLHLELFHLLSRKGFLYGNKNLHVRIAFIFCKYIPVLVLKTFLLVLFVKSTRMERSNWSKIVMQTGLKQALLRAHSQARFTVPKEQGRRSRTGEMAAQFFYSLGEVKSLRYYGASG
jgi:hypothetical protein